MALTKTKKADIIKDFKTSSNDVGSIFIQIAILTEEIKLLTAHLLVNKKDFISKRGLYQKVAKRKRLLAYLQTNDLQAYRDLLKKLDLRH